MSADSSVDSEQQDALAVEISPEESMKRQCIAQGTSIDFTFAHAQILPPIEDEIVDSIGAFTWEIKEYRQLTEERARSPVFNVGGWDFNMLLFPKGNAQSNVALYLEPQPESVVDGESGEVIPKNPRWYVCAQFTLIFSNPRDPKNCVISTSHQRFSKYATDWGFSNFVDLRQLYTARREFSAPLIWDDKLNVTAFIKVLKDPTGVLWHNFLDYDSKKETGFVGFKNQGATCYLNSLLQSYFFTKSFRRAVYQIPTQGESPTDSVPLALQRILYQLQRSEEAIDTLELTKSFGWDTGDAFTQHDVQELNRILMDRLETRMKGTPVENVLNKTFVGKMKSYIKCINVDYESARIEDFWDIQLNVKNLKNLTESFQNYVEVEVMDGENQYAAQHYGLQDAKKGVIFTEFPTVLHLQLKRFEYDFDYDSLVKINDRHEFPESIDLSPFMEHSDGECMYDLHGVLVHSGDISTGHYYAMIKPDNSDAWYRFDDDRVWKVTKREAFDQNFGIDPLPQHELMKMTRGKAQQYQLRRHTSAYMLVYIRSSEVDNVLQEVTDDDVPEYISTEVNKELVELAKKHKEMEELHLYLNINFFTNELFQRYQGFDLAANKHFVQHGLYSEEDFPHTIKALKTMRFVDLYPELKEKFGIDPETVNYWAMSYRRNHTLRPTSPLDINDITVDDLFQMRFSKKYAQMNIWIEQPELELFATVPKSLRIMDDDIVVLDDTENVIRSTKLLIFIKYFDVSTQTLKGLTHMIVNEECLIESTIPAIKRALSISEKHSLSLFEEINQGTIEEVNTKYSFYKSELGNGDIVCVQKTPQLEPDLISLDPSDIYPLYQSASDFYSFLAYRIHIKVQPLIQPSDDDFVLINEAPELDTIDMWISRLASQEELSTRIGRAINKDPKNLRIFANYNGNRIPLHSTMCVYDVIPKGYQSDSIPLFEYEMLNVALKHLENMTAVRVHWLSSGYCHYSDYEFLIEKDGTAADLINKMPSKIGFPEDQRSSVLLWTNLNCRFSQVISPAMDLIFPHEGTQLFAALLPEEKKVLDERYFANEDQDGDIEVPSDEPEVPLSRLVAVLQFYKVPSNLHGISFIFELLPDEPLLQTKERLQKKMGLGQKEFAKAQMCVWDLNRKAPVYMTDDDIVLYDEIADDEFLCLDLPDRTSRMGVHQGGGISIR